ncbi:MAG TPA: hypothetical protein DCG25_09520 [Acidimicrobiaceae bacterium]|nr:hypothetical protein [Acidimicrobiaceae bacterium]
MDAPDYSFQLRLFTQDYDGPRSRAIRHSADIFEFFTLLFVRVRMHRQNRAMVNAVLAYFVVPDDLFPEERLGPIGLVDDLFVAAHTYRILRREIPTAELAACWKGEEELEMVMDEVYRECRAEIGKKTKDALRLAGLS